MALATGMNPPYSCLPSRNLRASPNRLYPTDTTTFNSLPKGRTPCGTPTTEAQGQDETSTSPTEEEPMPPKSSARTAEAEGQEAP
ncbi:hypothetical protein SUGI_1044170 [Cryptomeria japonica]|nr:hypothetical protein SUGI_1044170 [Cryptomeria japonica]